MDNEEAKQAYLNAVARYDAGDFADALSLLDEVENARPNSRQVTYHRALCLTRLGRFDKASDCYDRLIGRIEPERLRELEAIIAAARNITHTPSAALVNEDAATIAQATVVAHVRPDDCTNVMLIESTFPASTTEATVTGHVSQGVFRVGEPVTVVSPNGIPLQAPIKRIGTAETPVNLVRAGQHAIMLLEVEPDKVVPGSALTSTAQEEAHARTMVAGGGSASPTASDTTGELHRIERQLRAGQHDEARDALMVYLEDEPDSRPAHRLMATLHLDEASPFHDPAKGLDFIRRAYELGGSNDPAVIHTLAQAMAQNGDAEHGLRFLDRYGEKLEDIQARLALAERIQSFRDQHALGNVWEFSDNYGEVLLETTSLDEAARALKTGAIPRDAKCRRNRIGEWRPLAAALATSHPEIAAFYEPAEAGGASKMVLFLGIIVVILVAAAILLALR